VVGNLLQSRYEVVQLVRRNSTLADHHNGDREAVPDNTFEVTILHKHELKDIEHSMVDELVKAHSTYTRSLRDERTLCNE
jgi:hypothetical protein